MDNDYQEFAPSSQITNFVHRVWSFAGPGSDDFQTIVPDGRPELIVHLGSPYFDVESREIQASVVFAGQLTRPLVLQSTGPVHILGVRFRPDGARHFLGSSLVEATDRRIDLLERHGSRPIELVEELRSAPDQSSWVQILESYVEQSIGTLSPDSLVRHTVEGLTTESSTKPQKHVGDRQFQRRFRREVGISLRAFKAIRRFRSVFDRLVDESNETWAQRAFEAGYFDQPQLAREFSRYLGCTPREWLQKAGGLETAIAATKG